MDASGNVYVAGSTNGGLSGPNAGLSDGFARKYESDGTPEWTQQFGTSSDDRINAAAADASGNLYVAGQTDGSLDGTSAGKYDCFVRKYDAGGTHEWTRLARSRRDPGERCGHLSQQGSRAVDEPLASI